MAEPVLKLTRGIPTTDRGWQDVFKVLNRFLRVSGDELVIDGTVSLPDGSVSTSKIANKAVTDVKLRDSQALSVVGRSVNSLGVPSDIQASTNGHYLRRSGDVLSFGAIAEGDIPATIARDTEVSTAISNHEAASDPHPGYTTAAELTTAISDHSAAADPHSVYPLAAGTETISGAWTFTASNPTISASAAVPMYRWNETDAAADNRAWRAYANGEQFIIDAVNDAASASGTFLLVDRTGTTIDEVRLSATLIRLNGAVRVDASTSTTSPSAGGAGALPATPAGYVTINIGGTDRQIAYY